MTDSKTLIILAVLLLNIANIWLMFSSKQYKFALFLAFTAGFVFNILFRMILGVS